MPWFRTRLPPSPGAVRAVDPVSLVVWTEHGLFRFEPGSVPRVEMLHDAAEAAAHFDSATGVMRWNRRRYTLVGDPAAVPHTSVEPALAEDDRGDRPGLALRVGSGRVEVAEGGKVTTVVPDFPAAGDAWHFTGSTGWRTLVLAGPSGLRRYHYTDPPEPPAPPVPPPPPPVTRWEAAGVAADNAALLASIVAAPDDDLPRLVYADWLEEQGGEADAVRAELIRVQCRIAERERTEPVPDTDPDRVRERELLAAPAGRVELPAVRGVEWSGCWRGFPGVEVKTATTLARSAARLLAAGPVEFVTCRNHQRAGFGGFAPLLQSPLAERVRVFELVARGYDHAAHPDDTAQLRELFASPRLAGLRGLILTACSDDVVPMIAGAAELTGLEWIEVHHMDDAGALALAASPHLPSLRWLRVGSSRQYHGREPGDPAARRALRERFAHVVFGGE